MQLLGVELNLLAVAIATVLAFVAGALWYSPFLFGPAWQKLVGLTDKQVESRMKLTMLSGFFLVLVMVVGFALVAGVIATPLGFELGVSMVMALNLITAALIWVLFMVPANVLNAVYAAMPLKLSAIDLGYQLVVLVVSAIVLGLII